MPDPARGVRSAPRSCVVVRRLTATLAAVGGLLGGPLAGTAAAQGEATATAYQLPTDAAVIDAFRLGVNPYGAGNRGVDLGTEPGDPVVSAAPGVVTFAGPVAGRLHVTVLHGDGLRTSYSFLESVSVRRGQVVEGGQVVGRAAGPVHWSARAGDAYLDPMLLLSAHPKVHLAPDQIDLPGEAGERSALERLATFALWGARSVAGVGAEALAWVADRQLVSDFAIAALESALRLSSVAGAAIDATLEVVKRMGRECTWFDQPAPPPPPEGSIVVLVGGLGSSSDNAAIWDLEAPLLAEGRKVVRFSYQGGSTDLRLYNPQDTTQDIAASGARLRALLAEVSAANPGIDVSVVAHSMGGLTARAALADGARDVGVTTLVTLGTPHQGADLAGLVQGLRRGSHPAGPAALAAVQATELLGFDARGPAIAQMAPGSDFLRVLDRRGLPVGLAVTAIGGRHDVVVPSTRAELAGARNTTVDPGGLIADHDALPGCASGLLEVRRALGGQPPTCESIADIVADAVFGVGIATAEDLARRTSGHITRHDVGGAIIDQLGGAAGRRARGGRRAA